MKTRATTTHLSDFSDSLLAERVAAEVLRWSPDGSRYRWSVGLGWRRWDGMRWREAPEPEVIEAVRLWGKSQWDEAYQLMRTGQMAGGDLARHNVLLSKAKLRAVVDLARGIDGILTEPWAFDAWPALLNTPSGVADLMTGEQLPHNPDLLMTRITNARYEPGARHPDWAAALNAIPEDARDWAQLRYGQATTGYMPPDDLLIVQQGSGENGKTTFSGAVAEALGDYYTLVPDRVILGNPGDHPTELMTLRGVRFALIEETPESRRLTVSRLKKVVGTPQITARLIRQDSVTFDATHSLFLSTNYRPVIEEVDHGTWRRLALLRFPYRFGATAGEENGRPADKQLRHRLKTDPEAQEAVLAWLVEGAVAWFKANQESDQPARVAADTREWRSESDVVLGFYDDRVIFDPGYHVVAAELLAELNSWLLEKGQREWSEKLLVNRFADHSETVRHGVTRTRHRPHIAHGEDGSAYYVGLSRRLSWGPPQAPVPAQYTAWFGLRFRVPSDPADPPPTIGGSP